jgi:hypothetical protein
VALVIGFVFGLWTFHETVVVMTPWKKTTTHVGLQALVAIKKVTLRGTGGPA